MIGKDELQAAGKRVVDSMEGDLDHGMQKALGALGIDPDQALEESRRIAKRLREAGPIAQILLGTVLSDGEEADFLLSTAWLDALAVGATIGAGRPPLDTEPTDKFEQVLQAVSAPPGARALLEAADARGQDQARRANEARGAVDPVQDHLARFGVNTPELLRYGADRRYHAVSFAAGALTALNLATVAAKTNDQAEAKAA